MKHTPKFDEFLNEVMGQGDPLDSIASSVVTSADFDRKDLSYYRDKFKNGHITAGINIAG
jgi:hypothetical protein